MQKRVLFVGLTGQTGAGKSTVSAMLRAEGFAVIDADAVTHQVLAAGSPFLAAVRQVFGGGLLLADGSLDRKATAALIFHDETARARYQAMIYPYITQAVRLETERLAADGADCVILDAPTLFESGIARKCAKIISVTADADTRLQRVLKRDSITREQALQRMQAQHSEEYFRAHSDFIIANNTDETALRDAVHCAAELLRQAVRENIQTNPKEDIIMEQKTDLKELRAALLTEKKHAAQILTDAQIAEADAFCEDYKAFLDAGKTEREAAAYAAAQLEAAGFRLWKRGEPVQSGDKIYMCNRGKAIVAAVIGTEPLESGIRLTAAHIDSPRLDLKQYPLYEDSEMALFKTHYYGGIKKYQWTVRPLALHGVVVKRGGETVTVNIGEDPADPVFCITDLLPHLGQEQAKRPLGQGIKGEELNLLIGSRPVRADEGRDLVKLHIMQLLNEKYGIVESDFLSAELEIVPAGKSRDLGFDRSMIAGYGHDDRVCAYPALAALLALDAPQHTAVTILTDKEEIGSVGTTGLCASYFHDFMKDLAAAFGTQAHTVFAQSQCLSADVTAAFDPTFSDVNDPRNSAYLNKGVCVMKYTGSRGKSGSSDASAEFVGKIRTLLDGANVIWQMGELGKVDAGGGGTVAAYLADLNIDTVDIGVPVLSMHAPMEAVSKLDVYAAYRAFLVFQQS